MNIQKIKCPYCGSLDVLQNVDGTYKCNECGHLIKPDLLGQASNVASDALSAGANVLQGVTQNSSEKRVNAGILAILLGTFGVHYFYLGKTKKGITTLLINLIPVVGSAICFLLGVVFGVRALASSDENFEKQVAQL
jgi:TM2 domain-containing membrane protein YozV/DNA-directed RNA polymerase subunit RPC12/RpoP